MNLEETTLNLVLEEGSNNTITYGGVNSSEGIKLDNSSLFISGEGGRLTMENKPGSPGLAISGVESTVAITGGTIGLVGQNIHMVGGTFIIGPKVTVLGNVPESAYDAGFVFKDGEASVKGDPVLPVDLTIPEECTLNVPAGTSLIVPENVTLTVEGAIRVETGGSITGTGDISGTVQHKLTDNMVNIEKNSYTYTGKEITPKVTIEEYDEDTDYTVAYENNTDAGKATITITPTGTGGLYGEVTMNFTIKKAEPEYTVPTNLTATYGEILEDVALPAGWTWEDNTLSVGEVGDNTFTAIFTPADTENYNTITQKVTITVEAKEEPEDPEPAPEPEPTPDPTPLYYNIQFEDVCEGVDASLSKSVVKEGNQVSVYIEVEEGYDAENLKVLFKRSLYGYWEEVEEGVQPGEYIIYNVYTDIYVKVEGVEKIEEEPTGMSDIEGTKVYAQNGSLYIYTSQPQEVMIITMNGTILKRERQEGLRSYTLPKGVYIICIGEERMKVRN